MNHLGRKFVIASLILFALLPAGAALAKSSVKHTHLTIHRTPKGDVTSGTGVTFYGRLRSSSNVCRSHQTIELIKIGSGVVATTSTDASGHYTFPAQVVTVDSVFQTRFGGSISGTHPNTRTCAGSTSRAKEVEVKGTGGAVLGTGGAAGTGAQGSAFTGRELLGSFRLMAVLIITGLAAIVVGRRRLRVARSS